ncbi:hypothetical protein BDV12DRAFT_96220 [Aspergillus spectabilis]
MNRQIGPTRRRLRVTTGCRTCRSCRVKCDEQKPICRNCAKRNRRCVYDNAAICSDADLNIQAHTTLNTSSPDRDIVVSEGVSFCNEFTGQLPSPDLTSIFPHEGRQSSFHGAIVSPVNPESTFHTPDSRGAEGYTDDIPTSVSLSSALLTTEQIPLTSAKVSTFRNFYVETVPR